MITAIESPSNENNKTELPQASDYLKKVSSTNDIANVVAKENEKPSLLASENTSVVSMDDNRQERTLAILTDTPNLEDIIEYIKSNGFKIIAAKHFEFTSEKAEKFYEDHAKQNYYEKGIRWLSSSRLYALVLEKENAIKDWRQLMGPTTYKKARKTSPNSIRALFGKDTPQNATHGSDSNESASKEIAYLFGDITIAASSTATATDIPIDAATDAADITHLDEKALENKEVPQQQHKADDAEDGLVCNSNSVSETAPAANDHETIIEPTENAISTKSVEASATDAQEKLETSELEDRQELDEANTQAKQSNAIIADANNVDPEATSSEIKSVSTNESSIKNEEHQEAVESDVGNQVNVAEETQANEEQQDTFASAATTVTNAAASVATTVVLGVAEVAAAAATAVSAAITTSGDDKESESDSMDSNEAEHKQVTIEETPVVHDIVIPETASEELPITAHIDVLDSNNAEAADVVPEITTAANQEKSKSEMEHTEISSTISSDKSSSADIRTADTHTDQRADSSKASILNDRNSADAEKKGASKIADQSTIKKSAKKSAANTRIRPPSINKGRTSTTKTESPGVIKTSSEESDQKSRLQSRTTKTDPSGTVKKPVEGSEQKPRLQSRTATAASNGNDGSANGASATRIARPSAPVKKDAEQLQQSVKKPVTKVSKHLPRVATLAKPPASATKTEQDIKDAPSTGEKTKKRLSSTKNFISRLTAPTVASANKKAAASAATDIETPPPTRRTSTLKKRQSLGAKPAKGNITDTQVYNKGSSQHQQPSNEMTSVSTNDSFSRPTTPSKNDHSDDKKQAFIDNIVENTI
ncbi:hypothetical protein [Parasitella parasitica]|uniref:Nucleoside diphosphate kinase n=1 Tax=Parasitella parasitica TaxID=35722 RepID=A0A0B7NSH8_9FUNG|nr:hypothetical protein [Parasitella parasitica]